MSETVDVRIGTVGRAHGLKGEVTVHLRTDEPERRFAVGAKCRADRLSLVVAGFRNHSGSLLVSFEGVSDRSAAEALRGLELWATVPAGEAPASAEEFYDRNLIGLRVQDHAGAAVGVVADVVHHPAHDSLLVRSDHGEYLVPFVAALVPVVNVEAGEIQLADVAGLVDDVPQG